MRWKIASLLSLAIAISYFDRQTLPVAIAAITREIPISNTQFSQLQAAFLVAYALMYAAGYNVDPEVITTLLKAGTDIKARDKDGMTAQMWAASKNENPEVIITLLKAGADGKAKDNEVKTAFDYAQDNEKLKGTDAYRQLQKASQ